MPGAVRPTTSAGAATRGTSRWAPTDPTAWRRRSSRYERVPADQYPVPEASPPSVVQPSRAAPRMRPVSQSWGRTQRTARARCSGSCVATQRSLLTVVAATGTTPVASAQAWPPSSSTRSVAACAERVSFHSSAGRTTSSCSSSRTMPCCWPPTETAATPSSSPPEVASSQADHQWRGSTSVPSGCAARPLRTTAPVCASRTTTLHDWVEVSTPATSGRSVMRPPRRAATCPGATTARPDPLRTGAGPSWPDRATDDDRAVDVLLSAGRGTPWPAPPRTRGRPRRCWPGSTGRPRPSSRPPWPPAS